MIPRAIGMPDTMTVNLRYRANLSGSANPSFTSYGLLEPLTQIPGYMTQLFDIYDRARITHSWFTFTGANNQTNPVEVLVAIAPASFPISTSVNFADLSEKKHSISRYVGGTSAVSTWNIKSSISTASLLGKEYALADYDFDAGQASSTTPLDPDEPKWIIAVQSPAANTDYNGLVIVESRVQFYGLRPTT